MPRTPSTDVEQDTTPVKALLPGAVTFFDSRQNTWSAIVLAGTTKEQLLQSGIWSVAGERFRAFDLVRVLEASRAYYAELLVVASGRGYCSMHLLSFHPLEALLTLEAGQLPPGFSIEYRGPDQDQQYCALRVADSVTIVRGKATREECLQELLNHASLH